MLNFKYLFARRSIALNERFWAQLQQLLLASEFLVRKSKNIMLSYPFYLFDLTPCLTDCFCLSQFKILKKGNLYKNISIEATLTSVLNYRYQNKYYNC